MYFEVLLCYHSILPSKNHTSNGELYLRETRKGRSSVRISGGSRWIGLRELVAIRMRDKEMSTEAMILLKVSSSVASCKIMSMSRYCPYDLD